MRDTAYATLALPVLGVVLLVSACTATAPAPPKVTVSGDAFSSVPLNARRLEIIENWQMPIEAPISGIFSNRFPARSSPTGPRAS